MLRLLVLGLVFVVPRLGWRACPGRKTPDVGDVTGELKVTEAAPGVAGSEPDAMASSTPLVIGVFPPEDGVVELERNGFASSDDGSMRSGGKRSFSISDFRLLKRLVP